MTLAINSQTAYISDRYLQKPTGSYSIAASGSMSSRALQNDDRDDIRHVPNPQPVNTLPDWLGEAIGLIHQTARQSRCRAQDCDGVTPGIESGSIHLLTSLAHGHIPHPYIYATRRGTIQFEWESESAYLEIEVVGERAAEWLFSDPSAAQDLSGDLFEDESLGHVLSLISRCVEKS